MSKVIGVIPARYASTRFPGKPLAKIQGREMILWVIDGAKKSKKLQEVIVATDDQRIADVVEKAGTRAIMTDSELPSGTDRIWQAIKDENCDVVINIQGDEPLVTGTLVDALAEPMLQDPSLEMATLGHALNVEDLQSLNVVKVVSNQKGDALYFSRFPIPYSRVNAKHSCDIHGSVYGSLKHIGMYAYRKSFLKDFCQTAPVEIEKAESLEQLRALHLGARIRVIQVQESSLGVDTPEDLKKVEAYLGAHK